MFSIGKTNEHQDAINILHDKGYSIEGSKNSWLVHYSTWTDCKPCTDRDLIKKARTYTSEGQRTNVKRNIKETQRRKNRARTRNELENERYDSFDKNRPVHKEDPWNWD